MGLLLKHASLLCGANMQPMEDMYVGISEGRIDYVGAKVPESPYEQEKNMRGKLLLPGLVNAHTHGAMTLFRGVGSDLPLLDWLAQIYPLEAKLTEDSIRVGTRLAMLEMLACGTTSFSDMYFFPEVTAEEVCAAKLQANLNRCITSGQEDPAGKLHPALRQAEEFFKTYHCYDNGRIRVDFSLHAEYTNRPDIVEACGALCRSYDGRMHIHLSESAAEQQGCLERNGKTPAAFFRDLGVLDNPTQAAHCVQVTREDLEILREKGVCVVHNPTSNLKLASGIAPVPEMLARGISVALGTDGAASNNNLNLFEEMHLAGILHKGAGRQPDAISPTQVIQMATVQGAQAQGRTECGVLEVGRQADLIALDLERPHMLPHEDLPATVVYTAQGSDVCMTMIRGEIVYENGSFFTIDAERTMAEAETLTRKWRMA